MEIVPITVAMAILYQQGKFLLQLRDDFPHIFYPGHWGLFGGHLEQGETPKQALVRELEEEIGYHSSELTFFNCYRETKIIRYLYYGPLTVELEYLKLTEGQDLALVTREEIAQGYCYSSKLNQIRPLVKHHGQYLGEFLETHKIMA